MLLLVTSYGKNPGTDGRIAQSRNTAPPDLLTPEVRDVTPSLDNHHWSIHLTPSEYLLEPGIQRRNEIRAAPPSWSSRVLMTFTGLSVPDWSWPLKLDRCLRPHTIPLPSSPLLGSSFIFSHLAPAYSMPKLPGYGILYTWLC